MGHTSIKRLKGRGGGGLESSIIFWLHALKGLMTVPCTTNPQNFTRKRYRKYPYLLCRPKLASGICKVPFANYPSKHAAAYVSIEV